MMPVPVAAAAAAAAAAVGASVDVAVFGALKSCKAQCIGKRQQVSSRYLDLSTHTHG